MTTTASGLGAKNLDHEAERWQIINIARDMTCAKSWIWSARIYKTGESTNRASRQYKPRNETANKARTPNKINSAIDIMFDKFRNKVSNSTTSQSRSRRNSEHSNIGRATLDVPTLVTPRPSSDSNYLPSYRSGSTSSGVLSKPRALSTPGDINRHTTGPGTPARTRRRDVFWKNGLWNKKHDAPSGPRVRAMSQSVTLPHPSVVEEQMRNMPHYDWRGRNRPDDVWDESNVSRLYA